MHDPSALALQAVTYWPDWQADGVLHSWQRVLLFLKYLSGIVSHAQVHVLAPGIQYELSGLFN